MRLKGVSLRSLCWVVKALISHYWYRPWQTLFLLSGLIAGVALWSGVQIVNQQARSSYADAGQMLGSQASFWVEHDNDGGIPTSLYLRIRQAGVLDLFPVVEFSVRSNEGKRLSILATDLMVVPGDGAFSSENPVQSSRDWLSFIQPPYQAWFDAETAEALNITGGQQLELDDGRRLPPALIRQSAEQGGRVVMDLGAAQSLTGSEQFNYLAVGPLTPEARTKLESLLPVGFRLVENEQHLDLKELTQSLHTHLDAMSLLSFAVGLFIVFNAVRFSLLYRRHTFMNLRLLGCGTAEIATALIIETLIWSLIGAGAGYALGVLLAQALMPGVSASLQGLYGATLKSVVDVKGTTLLLTWLITLGGLIWALFWPLLLQSRRAALVASRDSQQARDSRNADRFQAVLAALLVLVALLTFTSIENSADGFVQLALILFAAAMALPLILRTSLTLFGRVIKTPRFIYRWALADAMAQLPMLRSAMMALLLALIANVGVGVLVDSFRLSFTDWLSKRQSADLYIRANKVDYNALVEEGLESGWLLSSHQRYLVDVRWQGMPAQVRGLNPDARDSRELPLAKWLGSSPQDALKRWGESSDAVLINEQLSYLAGVSLGDEVELVTDLGPKRFTVIGLFYDYGNPYYQFYLPDREFRQLWPNLNSSGIALWLNPQIEGVTELAESALIARGLEPADWISQARIRVLSLSIFDQTFAITLVMNSLTLTVAAIALLASLLALMHQRMPQFAQWRAMGVTHLELFTLVLLPLLLFCALTWLISLPVGALLGWILIDTMNIVSFGWSMPIHWDVTPMLRLGAMVALIVLLTAGVVAIIWKRQLARSLAQIGELI